MISSTKAMTATKAYKTEAVMGQLKSQVLYKWKRHQQERVGREEAEEVPVIMQIKKKKNKLNTSLKTMERENISMKVMKSKENTNLMMLKNKESTKMEIAVIAINKSFPINRETKKRNPRKESRDITDLIAKIVEIILVRKDHQ